MGMPTRREWSIDVPAPVEEPFVMPSPARPEPAPAPEPVEVPS